MPVTEINHADGSTTHIVTNVSGDTEIFNVEADGSRHEIGSEGAGLLHDQVVAMYRLGNDISVVKDEDSTEYAPPETEPETTPEAEPETTPETEPETTPETELSDNGEGDGIRDSGGEN